MGTNELSSTTTSAPSAIPFAVSNGSNVRVMSNYIPIGYPKWIDGVVVRNLEEEQAHRATLTEAAKAARAAELTRLPSPAGIRMRRTLERRRLS